MLAAAPRTLDQRGILTLAIGHFSVDLAQGVPPALLVFLVPKLHLTYAMGAGVILAVSLSASIVQPLSGRLSDRPNGAMWLLSAGVLLGSCGVALAAVAPNYPLVLLCVFAAGLGIGVYHPEAAKFAGYVSGARRASGMSLFAIGGNAGVAVGPLLTSTIVVALGLVGGLLLIVPGVLAAALILFEARYLRGFVPSASGARDQPRAPGQPRALGLLVAISVLRSVGYFGIFTFVPLYEVAHGVSKSGGTRLLTYVLATGVVATLAAGPIADRVGGRPVLFWSGLICAPLLAFYVVHRGLPGDAALMLAGASISATFGVQIAMAQQYMPGGVALASGLIVGVPIGLGAAAAVVLGAIADAVDLRAALLLTTIGPALAAVLTLGLAPVGRGALTPAPQA